MAKKFIQNNNDLAVAYYRYSSHAQSDASIEQQREAAKNYADGHGLQIVKEYEDAAISGTTDQRPGFQLMLSEIGKIRPAALTAVTIPASVTAIGDHVFYWCSGLLKIEFAGTLDAWKALEKGSGWDSSTGAYTVDCTNGSLTKEGTETQA